jgi:tRNA(adenine34) deaminase
MIEEMQDDEYFMRAALAQAEKAFQEDEVPVGAVVVCRQQIIARAYNMTEKLHDVTAHAEMLAITSAADFLGGKYLKDCTLYVTLEPCMMCAGALLWTQIGKIVYGAADPKRGYVSYGCSVLHPKTSTVTGILEQSCSKMLQDFFKSKRN